MKKSRGFLNVWKVLMKTIFTLWMCMFVISLTSIAAANW